MNNVNVNDRKWYSFFCGEKAVFTNSEGQKVRCPYVTAGITVFADSPTRFYPDQGGGTTLYMGSIILSNRGYAIERLTGFRPPEVAKGANRYVYITLIMQGETAADFQTLRGKHPNCSMIACGYLMVRKSAKVDPKTGQNYMNTTIKARDFYFIQDLGA